MKKFSEEYKRVMGSLRWKRLKWKVILLRGRYCERCKIYSRKLDLHHKHYRTLGKEEPKDVRLLCRPCHDGIHSRRRKK